MSLKIQIIVNDIIDNNKDYKIIPSDIIKSYIKQKFKCSSYQANQVIKMINEKK
jgi:hypothetical protein